VPDGRELVAMEGTEGGRFSRITPVVVPAPVPTAKHVVGDAHATDLRPATPLGRFWLVQVDPPSVVTSTTPFAGRLLLEPTTRQSLEDKQATPLRSVELGTL
jgi:hypothetical protein